VSESKAEESSGWLDNVCERDAENANLQSQIRNPQASPAKNESPIR